MEPIKLPENSLIKNTIGAAFTDDEKQKINELLPPDVPDTAKWKFISECFFLCNRILLHRESPDKLKYKSKKKQGIDSPRKDALKDLNIAKAILTQIATGKTLPQYPQNLADLSNIKDETNFEAAKKATVALAEVNDLIESFEKGLAKIKDKRSHNDEFAANIYDAYVKYIGKPTTSINDSFPHILIVVFKAVGIEIKTPESASKLAKKIIKEKSSF